MREVRFDDYLTEGIDAIAQTARRMSGARHVHAVGYCIGGAAASVTDRVQDRESEQLQGEFQCVPS